MDSIVSSASVTRIRLQQQNSVPSLNQHHLKNKRLHHHQLPSSIYTSGGGSSGVNGYSVSPSDEDEEDDIMTDADMMRMNNGDVDGDHPHMNQYERIAGDRNSGTSTGSSAMSHQQQLNQYHLQNQNQQNQQLNSHSGSSGIDRSTLAGVVKATHYAESAIYKKSRGGGESCTNSLLLIATSSHLNLLYHVMSWTAFPYTTTHFHQLLLFSFPSFVMLSASFNSALLPLVINLKMITAAFHDLMKKRFMFMNTFEFFSFKWAEEECCRYYLNFPSFSFWSPYHRAACFTPKDYELMLFKIRRNESWWWSRGRERENEWS